MGISQITSVVPPYRCTIYRASALSATSASDSVQIPWDTVSSDPYSMSVMTGTGSTSGIKALVAGTYILTGHIMLGGITSAATTFGCIWVNNSLVAHDLDRGLYGAGSGDLGIGISKLLDLNASDLVNIAYYESNSSASVGTGLTETWMSLALVSVH